MNTSEINIKYMALCYRTRVYFHVLTYFSPAKWDRDPVINSLFDVRLQQSNNLNKWNKYWYVSFHFSLISYNTGSTTIIKSSPQKHNVGFQKRFRKCKQGNFLVLHKNKVHFINNLLSISSPHLGQQRGDNYMMMLRPIKYLVHLFLVPKFTYNRKIICRKI